MNQKDLLEDLANILGLDYLSDLRRPQQQHAVLLAMKRLSPEDYPIAQWNDALEYILNQNVAFSSLSETLQFLDNI